MATYSEQELVALAIVFAVIPLISVALRLWTKKLTPYGIRTDDWLCIGALSITIGSSASMLIATINGNLGQHMIPGPDGQPDLSNSSLPAFEQSKFAFNILSVLGLGFAKTSVLVYCRHTINNRPYRIMIDVFLGVVSAYTIGYTLASIFACHPVTPYVEPVFGNQCMNTTLVQLSNMCVNLALDFLILFVPVLIAMLRKTASGLHQLGLVVVFLLGLLVSCIGVARAIVANDLMHLGPSTANDLTYNDAPLLIWTFIELSLSVLVGCLATLRPLFGGPSVGVPKNPGYTIGYATQVYSSADGVDGRWTPLGSIKNSIMGGDSDKEDYPRPEHRGRKQSETAKWGAEFGGVRVEHSLNVRAESRQEAERSESRQEVSQRQDSYPMSRLAPPAAASQAASPPASHGWPICHDCGKAKVQLCGHCGKVKMDDGIGHAV